MRKKFFIVFLIFMCVFYVLKNGKNEKKKGTSKRKILKNQVRVKKWEKIL
jgi:hypothetical protein